MSVKATDSEREAWSKLLWDVTTNDLVEAYERMLSARLAPIEALADEWADELAAFCVEHGVQYAPRCNGCDSAEGANTTRTKDVDTLRAALATSQPDRDEGGERRG